MKTADLIPLILLELNENDKYGLEITKSIETKSNGNIMIKQPTLYTILKKLEKSKFITSYWQDSDIGGKRHYYKITDNGRLQVSTLPSMRELINSIINEAEEEEVEVVIPEETNNSLVVAPTLKPVTTPDKDSFSIMNMLETSTALVETVVPSEDVFSTNDIDTATTVEINQNNTDLLKNDNQISTDTFANNTEVSSFTKKPQTTVSEEYKQKVTSLDHDLTPKITPQESISSNHKDIKYVDYIDFKKDENYIYAKKTARSMMCKMIATAIFLTIILTLCSAIVGTNTSAFYYVCVITSVCFVIFYPSLYVFNYEKFRLRCETTKYEPDRKKRLIICAALELFFLLICTITNISIGKSSILAMLSFDNFANFYAPILMSTTIFADIIFNKIFLKKNK